MTETEGLIHVGWISRAMAFLHSDAHHRIVCSDDDCEPVYKIEKETNDA